MCNRFEGVDERFIEAHNLREVSMGDYILSGGEMAAFAMLDAIIRLLPGVMGKAESGTMRKAFPPMICWNIPNIPGPQAGRGAIFRPF